MFAKRADGETASIPQIQIPSQPAQDKNTVSGVVPPISYTRVNAGTPATSDAGSQSQKSQAPMGAQMLPKTAKAFSREDRKMTMTSRPLIQDLVKSAMANAASRAQIAAEGARQLKLAEEKCGECGETPCECEKTKKASDPSISSDFALKLAAAVEYVVPILAKVAEGDLPEGVTKTDNTGSLPGPGGYGKGTQQAPMDPALQKASPKEQSPTQMQNTMDSPPGGSGTQTTALTGGKTASVQRNLEALSKVGFSITEKGHAFDAADAEMEARHGAERQALRDHFSGGRFGLSSEAREHITSQGGPDSGTGKRLVDLLRFGPPTDLDVRHHEYVAKKHRDGENAYNPFGGTLTPSKHEVGGDSMGFGAYRSRAPEHPKEASALFASNLERVTKLAFSVTDEGHKYDKAVHEAARDAAARRSEAREAYTKDSPGMAAAHTYLGDTLGGKGVGHFSGITDKLRERHNDYAAKEHAGGHNAMNPFGGMLTKTEREKKAFSVTDAGHKYDAERGHAESEEIGKRREARKEYSKERPFLAHLGTEHIKDIGDLVQERHQNYVGNQHDTGHNAFNPLGGLLTKTPREKKAGVNLDALAEGLRLTVKQAEDAINPAHISAGAAVPPDTNASGEAGGSPVAGMPQGPRGLVGSNESAIGYKRNAAYSGRKSELAQYFNEPALSSAHDTTLQAAFAHTGEAGTKLSSAQETVKSAAARALLMKIAERAEANKKTGA